MSSICWWELCNIRPNRWRHGRLERVSLTTDALANLCEAELLVSWSVEGLFGYLVHWY